MSISKTAARLLAIGDIHGYLDELRQLLDRVRPTADDTVIFLGDYIDRGPDSRGVLETLIAFRERFPRTIFLRGNHEQMFMDALAWHERESAQSNRDLDGLRERADYFGLKASDLVRIWLREGGLETLASFGGSFDQVGPAHRAFLEATRFYHEERRDDGENEAGFLFVHAGADVTLAPERQHPLALMNHRGFTEPGTSSPWTVVHGHTIRLDGPEMKPKRLNLDTGVYVPGGRLTCCDVLTRHVWQVPQGGH